MKKLTILLLSFMAFACNSATHEKTSSEKRADSLYKEVDDLHGSAMSKSFKLEEAQKKIQAAIDSIAKLPENLKQASAKYKFQLDSLLDKIKYTGYAMNTWMENYKFDTLTTEAEKRVEYLTSEKLKISRVKEMIVNNIKAADSLLQKK